MPLRGFIFIARNKGNSASWYQFDVGKPKNIFLTFSRLSPSRIILLYAQEGRIKRHGYTLESHQLTTDDGYILPLYRIPNGMKPNKNHRNKSAVLLMHGLGGGPSNWVREGLYFGCSLFQITAFFSSTEYVTLITAVTFSMQVTLGAKQSLPYYLADRDFDVWMLCARGVVTPSEKKHVKLDWNKDKEFWHFR